MTITRKMSTLPSGRRVVILDDPDIPEPTPDQIDLFNITLERFTATVEQFDIVITRYPNVIHLDHVGPDPSATQNCGSLSSASSWVWVDYEGTDAPSGGAGSISGI